MHDALIDKYSAPLPRYTSYPTAPHFHDGIGSTVYGRWLGELQPDAPLSLYFHIPYCDRLCWFCGCHTKMTKRYEPIAKYLLALRAEIASVAAALGGRGRVTAVHFGGGSPTMLTPGDLVALDRLLRESFRFAADAEISVEMDPNDMDEGRYDALERIGLTRASLGLQDFNPRVQAAINRIQTFEQTREVVEAVRLRGARSVNLDVLYGLPFQTLDTIAETMEQVLSLRPDRVAVFGYAHVPWMKKHQSMIDATALPDARARFMQARAAGERLLAAGFEAIGFDHFALPGDSLATARRSGRLHRNFQGYTADAPAALIGFGASAIGQLPQGYVQNEVATGEYERLIAAGGLATARGFALSEEDRMRAYVIERLMCDFALSFAALRQRFGVPAEQVIREAGAAAAEDADGLVRLAGDSLVITSVGRPFVRAVAARFDGYLRQNAARYSIAV